MKIMKKYILICLEVIPVLRIGKDIDLKFSFKNLNNIKHICDGSHSNVYEGNFQDRAVILKVLLDKDFQNITANKEFQNEIMILSKISHPWDS